MTEPVSVKALDIHESLSRLERDIKGYKKKYEEDVKVSLGILPVLKSDFNDNLLRIVLFEEESKADPLFKDTRKLIERLRLFALSEIIHRKLQEIRFKLANPFFFRKSKEEFRRIMYELEDIDGLKDSDGTSGYENLIKRTRALEDGISEERSTGLLNYLKWVVLVASGWVAAFLTYFSIYAPEQLHTTWWNFVLPAFLISFFFIPLLLLFWNYIFYGIKYMTSDKRQKLSTFVALLVLGSFFFLMRNFIPWRDTGVIALEEILVMPMYLFTFLIVISLPYWKIQKRTLLRKDVEDLVNQFGFDKYR